MLPDLRTLILATSILCAVQALGMLVLWSLNRRMKGIGLWAAGNVLNAVTTGLLPLQGLIDNRVLTVLTPNLCAVSAAVLFLVGTRTFIGLTRWNLVSTLVLAVLIPCYAYFVFIQDSLGGRIQVASLILMFFYGQCGVVLVRERESGLRFSARFTGLMFLGYGGMLVLRMLRVAIEPPPSSFFDATMAQWLMFLGSVTLAYLWNFGTILLIIQRQTLEISERHAAQLRAEEALAATRREALVRDLHDGIGGITANLAMLAGLGREEEQPGVREETLRHIQTMALEGNREVRTLMSTLENGHSRWADWLAELRTYAHEVTGARRIKLAWQVAGTPEEPVIGDAAAAISLTRAVKEAVHNLTRHSQASEARIEIDFSPQRLGIVIADNGLGLPAEIRPGRGLTNMKRRAQELGGSLEIATEDGTLVHFGVPLPLKYPDANLVAR
jgi:signal transduction histidine kinase